MLIAARVREESAMANFDNLVAKVEAHDSVEPAVLALLAELREKLAHLEPTKAAIDKFSAKIEANSRRIAVAVSSRAAVKSRVAAPVR